MLQLLDFYADWCGPCVMMKPIFEELEQMFLDKVEFKKVDVEEEGAMAQQYGVMSIPTFVLLKDGKEVARRTGVVAKDTFAAWLNENLK